MQFELSESLIADILFFMEDQKGSFSVDTLKGTVVSQEERQDSGINEDELSRYIELPEWNSTDGFNLMERFSSYYRDPLIRNELKAALAHGRGVFRYFKDTLGLYPDAEKLWYAFKEKEMKRDILEWYNALREEWGLEKIGMEPEDTEDLVLEDFRFRAFIPEDMDRALELHKQCLEEHRSFLTEKGTRELTNVIPEESPVFSLSFDSPKLRAMSAETAEGEFAAYIAGLLENAILHIYNLEVKDEYRGLGIGESLLNKFLENLDNVHHVLLDLPPWAEGFSRVLLREAFQPLSIKYHLDLRDRKS